MDECHQLLSGVSSWRLPHLLRHRGGSSHVCLQETSQEGAGPLADSLGGPLEDDPDGTDWQKSSDCVSEPL